MAEPTAHASLAVQVAGIPFGNPVLPAAGPPGRNGRALLACAEGGAGGLVAKTISTAPAHPPRPNMAQIPHGFLNTELWSELPPEQWIEREYALAKTAGLPLIVSLGYTAAEIATLAPQVRPYADALELSTHYLGEDAQPMIDAIRAAKDAVDVPVFVKLSPLGREMGRAAALAAEAGADGIAAINSFGPCLAIDIERGRPRLGGESGYGWLSGPALKPLAVRCVYDVAAAVDLPILGVGGISSGADAIEMVMAGAWAVQVCTEAILRGPEAFGRIAREMGEWLDDHGYTGVAEIRGLAHQRERASGDGVPALDPDACTGCGLCERSCPYDAIHVIDGVARLDVARCAGCGLCVSRCRFGALVGEW